MQKLIIPSINCQSFEEAKKKILASREFLQVPGYLHIDVADGGFSPISIWGDFEEFRNLISENDWLRKINFEIHLMISDPERVFSGWVESGVSRIIVHSEAISDLDLIINKCKQFDVTVMVAIKPETPVTSLKKYFSKIHHFQILSVAPGWSGQIIKPDMVEKVANLRKLNSDAIIEVDGGVNLENIKSLDDAGANLFVSSSCIWNARDPKIAFMNLNNIVNKD